MLNIRRILVPTDFSDCSIPALDHAVKLAQDHHAEVHLFHTIVLHDQDHLDTGAAFPDSSKLAAILADYSQNRLDALVRDHSRPGMVFSKNHRRGISAASPIIEYATQENIDLIVMGTHGRRGIRKMFLGSVASEVIRLAPCSVLTVRDKGERTAVHDLGRILAPVDFSDQGKEALKVALELSRGWEAEVDLLHVLGEVLHPAFYEMGAVRLTDLQPDILEKAKSELEGYVQKVADCQDLSVSYHSQEGHAAREIVRFSRDRKCDLIVMATHGHTDKRHFLIGGTAEKVISRAECPVLSIHAEGRTLLDSGTEATREPTG